MRNDALWFLQNFSNFFFVVIEIRFGAVVIFLGMTAGGCMAVNELIVLKK